MENKSKVWVFASVGRLDVSVKGQAILLQILKSDVWKERNWILNFYGSGPDEAYLRFLVKEWNLEGKVFFKGFVLNIRKEVWSDNHILLLPSYYEGMPLTLVEAMLCGRTAVVTDVGGNSELLTNGVDGFIANATNKKSFEIALEKAWNQRREWSTYGENAFFSAKNYIEKHSNNLYLY